MGVWDISVVRLLTDWLMNAVELTNVLKHAFRMTCDNSSKLGIPKNYMK